MSKKLIGAIAGMVAVTGIVALTAWQVVDKDIVMLAIIAVTGLGGYQIARQATLDANGGKEG